MAKKQTFVVGSSNPITESLSDAQLNQGWNQFEVLKAGTLDGVLKAISDQSQINADEITNALDVYSLTPDPTDNTQLKQVLTTMDNKINQVVSGGEIIGSFWFGKTTAGFTVPAPTIIGQTYIDFTTLNYYVSNDGSTWTLDGTLTLPALQDAIVLITSKFWDIAEQTNQYGGRAIYSHDLSSWTYYPTVIDLSGYVTKTTAQTISGTKTFSANLIKKQNLNDDITNTASIDQSQEIVFTDRNGTTTAYLKQEHKNAVNALRLGIRVPNGNDFSVFNVLAQSGGYAYATAPASSTNGSVVITSSHSYGTSGFMKFGNGLIVQWTTVPNWDGNFNTVRNWPTAFSSATSYKAIAGWGNAQVESAYPITVWEQTSTGVRLQVYTGLGNQGRAISLIGIGY